MPHPSLHFQGGFPLSCQCLSSLGIFLPLVLTLCTLYYSESHRKITNKYKGIGISSRMILEDHLLDDQFLLKKGNILLIPGVVQHQDRSVWGDNVLEFYHKRFVVGAGGKKGSRRLNPVAFRDSAEGQHSAPVGTSLPQRSWRSPRCLSSGSIPGR